MTGLFTEQVSKEMIETRGFNGFDMVALFLGALVDLCYGLTSTAAITKLILLFVDLVSSIIWYDKRTKRDEHKIKAIFVSINALKITVP